MFDLFNDSTKDCSGVSRRQFLRVGGLSALGLSLSGFLRLREAAAAKQAPDRKALEQMAPEAISAAHCSGSGARCK